MEQNSTTGSRNIMPFKMAGSEKMRIDTFGNVGIGTSAPSYLLDVYGGSGRISTPSNDGTLYLGTSTVQYKNSTNTICLGAASINTAAATGTNNLAVGNACMGSVSTGSNNTACGNTALTGTTLGSNNTGVGFSAGSGISSGTGNVYVGAAAAASSGGANNEIVIGAGAVGIGNNSVVLGNDNVVTTSLNGNVGIKTKLPAAVLDVNGAVKFRGALDLSTQNITNANQISANQISVNQVSANQISVNQVSATTNLVLQPTSGNVGIGTSTPEYTLDVNGIVKTKNPYLLVTGNQNTNETANNGEKLKFNTIITDTHNGFNTSQYVYTVPISGYYLIGGSVYLNSTSRVVLIAGSKSSIFTHGGSNTQNGNSIIYYLSQGNTVYLQAGTNGLVYYMDNTYLHTYMYMYMIG